VTGAGVREQQIDLVFFEHDEPLEVWYGRGGLRE
jgi:hypothetical protein